ncbi:MAG: 5'-3' exonuclease H3TH domain-containing protein [Candidatus Eiseniibacteriota bacterium]|jgi:DNA polymerase-1
MDTSRVCLIDANNYLFRAYHAIPAMHAPDGEPVNATYGFARTLLKLLREREPRYVAALFESGASFREELAASYKANRPEPPDDLVPQFLSARRVTSALGIPGLEVDGFEADDLMGTLATRLSVRGLEVLLVSGDKDLAQLVAPGITLLDVAKNRELDEEGVTERFGVRPDQIIDYLALVGDPVDNIPGLPGVGPKTAQALLAAAGSLDALLARPGQIAELGIRGHRRVLAALEEVGEQLHLSRRLATIRRDVPVDVDVPDLEYHGARRRELEPLFDRLGFGARIRGEIRRWAPEPSSTGRLDL